MAKRKVERLSALAVAKMKEAGYYADGKGLYLRVLASGGKSWAFIFARHGRSREMSLGPYPDISLEVARQLAFNCRQQVREGIDPIEQRRQTKAVNLVESAKAITFAEAAEQYIAKESASWKNAKHQSQWVNTLSTYAFPVFGRVPVAMIDKALVLKVLSPIWPEKLETATRLRQRIERVLGWATNQGLRSGENPARWQGALEHDLPAIPKKRRVKHHPSLPYKQIAEFSTQLRAHEGIAARGLEFCILTAARAGEVLSMQWSEIDEDFSTWRVPAEKMKAGRPHLVPLSVPAKAILRTIKKAGTKGPFVFAHTDGKPLSNRAFAALIERMNAQRSAKEKPLWTDPEDGRIVVPHGFRSTFRVWAAEKTNFSPEVIEFALAHTIGDEAIAAYLRSTSLLKRSKLMESWSTYTHTQEISNGNHTVTLIALGKA